MFEWISKLTNTFNKQSIDSDSAYDKLLHEDFFNELRANEFSRLDELKQVYLDYTGGGLYAKSQIDTHFSWLSSQVLGNPHSTNPTSQAATKAVDEARAKVLSFFNATEDYHCIFTMNASGALKIVGESYPFQDDGVFILTADNHNSVNGIREYCKGKGGVMAYAPIQAETLTIDPNALESILDAHSIRKNKLFAFPAQSNVTGIKHDLTWVEKAQAKGWDVLLDAAAYVPTSPLNLTEVQPNFVSVSFYKIFGYPTGLGCLLLRKDTFQKLQKPWFAGGTVTLASVQTPEHFLADTHERFEDGTVSYLSIPAVKVGLDYMDAISIPRLNERIKSLTIYLLNGLESLKYENGQSKVQVFGKTDLDHRGGTLVMSFFDSEGNKRAFEKVEEQANELGISIRSGCFCNPGIDEVNNCLTTEELSQYYVTHKKGDYKDMIAYLGKMRGATRVSVGMATNQADLDRFIQFVDGLV
jgi:selenocysteine lyase/cysteine desulfurase